MSVLLFKFEYILFSYFIHSVLQLQLESGEKVINNIWYIYELVGFLQITVEKKLRKMGEPRIITIEAIASRKIVENFFIIDNCLHIVHEDSVGYDEYTRNFENQNEMLEVVEDELFSTLQYLKDNEKEMQRNCVVNIKYNSDFLKNVVEKVVKSIVQ